MLLGARGRFQPADEPGMIERNIIALTPQECESDRHIPGTVARPVLRKGIVL